MEGRTVLIVDDHDVLRGLLQSSLQDWFTDVRIHEAADAETAVALAAETEPDVVIMDIALPGMNGIEATREIKKVRPETRVVILSVHELDAYRNDAAAAGADAYIPKRLMQTELNGTLSDFFDEIPARPSADRDDRVGSPS